MLNIRNWRAQRTGMQTDIRQGDGTINRQGTNREWMNRKTKRRQAVNHKGGNNKKQNTHAGSKNTIRCVSKLLVKIKQEVRKREGITHTKKYEDKKWGREVRRKHTRKLAWIEKTAVKYSKQRPSVFYSRHPSFTFPYQWWKHISMLANIQNFQCCKGWFWLLEVSWKKCSV